MAKFRMAVALYITPDFSDVIDGKIEAPYVNHKTLDFNRLAKALKDTFIYGPPFNDLRVANDTIDLVTTTLAIQNNDFSLVRFGEAGELLLNKDKKSSHGDVIDVRDGWDCIHAPDYGMWTCAPPPTAVIFVVEHDDFEDAMMWLDQSKACLGLTSTVTKMMDAISGTAQNATEQTGVMPAHLHSELAAIFGVSYQTDTLIDWCCLSKKPGRGYDPAMFDEAIAEGKRVL